MRGCRLIYGCFVDTDLPAGTILHDITPETKVWPEAANHYKYVISLDDPDCFLLYNQEYLGIIDRDMADHLIAINTYKRLNIYKNNYLYLQEAIQIQLGDCVFVKPFGYEELTGKLRYKGRNGRLPGTWFGVELDQVMKACLIQYC